MNPFELTAPVIPEPLRRNELVMLILHWRAADGALVRRGDAVCEIEMTCVTGSTSSETAYRLRAKAAGHLTHAVADGAILTAGQLLATIRPPAGTSQSPDLRGPRVLARRPPRPF